MITMRHRNELKRRAMAERNEDLRERAKRADAIVFCASLAGLTILLIVQLMEKYA